MRLATRLLLPEVGQKQWTNFAKGVGIGTVVYYHTMLFLRAAGFDNMGMGHLRIVLDMVPMPIFFVIAGLFHYRVLTWTLKQTWQRRLAVYLYLYVLWTLIRFVFFLVLPLRPDGPPGTGRDPLALLTIFVWPINVYWFVYALFLYGLVLWATRKLPAPVPIVPAAVLSLAVSSGVLASGNPGVDRILEYLAFFLVAARYSSGLFRAVRRAPVLPTVLVSGAAYACFAITASYVPWTQRIPGVNALGAVACVVLVAVAGTVLVRVRPLAFVGHLGERSLTIYLVHVFVVAVYAGILQLLPLPSGEGLFGPVLIFVSTALMLLLSTWAGRWVARVPWLLVPPKRRKRASAPAPAVGRASDVVRNR